MGNSINQEETMKYRYKAQFYKCDDNGDNMERSELSADSVPSLKRKLSKINIVGSAAIHDMSSPMSETIYYKPRYHHRNGYHVKN